MITAGAESVGSDIVYLRQKLTFVSERCIPFVLFPGDDPVPWSTGKSTRRIVQSYRTRETSRFYGSRFSALHKCYYQRSPEVRTTNFHFFTRIVGPCQDGTLLRLWVCSVPRDIIKNLFLQAYLTCRRRMTPIWAISFLLILWLWVIPGALQTWAPHSSQFIKLKTGRCSMTQKTSQIQWSSTLKGFLENLLINISHPMSHCQLHSATVAEFAQAASWQRHRYGLLLLVFSLFIALLLVEMNMEILFKLKRGFHMAWFGE